MQDKKGTVKFWCINIILLLVLFLIQYNGTFSLKIGTANPMLPLCAVITFSMFESELPSFIFGLLSGVLTDGAAGTPIGFNAIIFMLLALTVSLTVHYLFNSNFRAAIVLGILCALFYFIVRWIFVYLGGDLQNEVKYVMNYLLPSTVYTGVIMVPLFFAQRLIYKKCYGK